MGPLPLLRGRAQGASARPSLLRPWARCWAHRPLGRTPSLPPPPAPSGAGAPSPLSVPRPCSRPLPPLKRPLLSNGPQVHADAGPLWQATRERQAATWASEARSWPCPTPGLPPGNSTLSSRAARPGGNAPSPAPPDPTYDAHKRIASRTSDSNALPPLPLPGLPPLLP